MSFGAKKIFPIDQNSRKAIGVSLPFNQPAVFGSTYLTKDAIRNNLINYVLTNPGERLFDPNYGLGLKNYIFEQITNDSIDSLSFKIQTDINQYFPSIQAKINIIPDNDFNTINIYINYSIINTGITDTIEINFNNGN